MQNVRDSTVLAADLNKQYYATAEVICVTATSYHTALW
jgi:hypothetical protein